MAVVQITWEQFIVNNNDARGVNYKFEDLCRQLFAYELLSENSKYKFLHSNPNNPGIESEPIWDEINNRYIGYQAKFFDKNVDYKQIKDSMNTAISHYSGKLDTIYLFCNEPITTTCDSYLNIESDLKTAGINLQLITNSTILDLVRKYDNLGQYYFGSHGITYDWLANKTSTAMGILGERFNSDFNVDTEASKNLSVFLQNQNAVHYYNDKKQALLKEIASLHWKLDHLYGYANKLSDFVSQLSDITHKNIADVENWHNSICIAFKDDIIEIDKEIEQTKYNYETARKQDSEDTSDIKSSLDNLTKLKELFFRLELPEIEKELLNNKILIVTGKAGIGKTQLFANEAHSIINAKENALLIVGSDCLSDINILEQLQNNLRLDFNFEDLIDILDVMGESSGKITPIFIDALNESWKPQLWKSVLPILYNKVHDKKYVRLAISFRSEYQKTLLPERFLELKNVMKMEHVGFRSNTFEAVKQFLNHYKIPFSPSHILINNIDNPLFLTLYCKTYTGDDAELPTLYDRLLEKTNEKIYFKLSAAIESAGYDSSDNLVVSIVEAISEKTLESGKRHFEKSEIEALPIWKSLGLVARPFITQLLTENILQDYESKGKNYVYFTFDQMNDYFSAKSIVSRFNTEEEVKRYVSETVLGIIDGELTNWGTADLFVHICALYSNKFGKECIDILRNLTNESDKEDLFRTYIESFEWRSKIHLSIQELINFCDEFFIDPSDLWNAFINNSVKPSHLLNADALHTILNKYSLSRRDYLWTTFINGRNSEEDRIVQLIEIYNKGEQFAISEKEQVRLLLVLFSWVLTSSNRWLRDTTSKAMIEILKEHFEFSEYLLKLFSEVNDPYVLQRLYGIVFGACTKRNYENKDTFTSLADFVFKDVFNKEIVYPDILLRDYARLIIEQYINEYPDELQDYDLSKIKPPYKSTPIPELEDQKYLDKDYHNGLFFILHSMRFEGMGMYGDFGRYVFQSALRNFDVDHYKIFNYAMYHIINELNYNEEYFDEYDRFVRQFSYDRHRVVKTERIGKKYQWITMYNILARVSDYSPMKDSFSSESKSRLYDGPWEPYVRDFDPTLNEYNLLCNETPLFQQVRDHTRTAIQINKSALADPKFDEDSWITAPSVFFSNQKDDLLLTDETGSQWVVLSRYADTDRRDLAKNKLLEWNWLYGYFVTDNQLETLKEYAHNKKNLLTNDITWIPETYTLYNREYPWSSGSKSLLDYQWVPIELKTGETQTVTITVEEPDYSQIEHLLKKYSGELDDYDENDSEVVAEEDLVIPFITRTYDKEEPITLDLGKILNTTQDLLWEEEFDGSKKEAISCSHPCAEIINTLELKQTIHDGYYYNKSGTLIAFDTALMEQKVGLIIRKEALDVFLSNKELHLIWIINASKEVHGESLSITKYADWTGLLEYDGDSIKGEYYINNCLEM